MLSMTHMKHMSRGSFFQPVSEQCEAARPADPGRSPCGQQNKVLLERNSALWTAPRPAPPTLESQRCTLAGWARGLSGQTSGRVSPKVQEGSCSGGGDDIFVANQIQFNSFYFV